MPIEFDCKIKHETAKAVLIEDEETATEYWLPFSHVKVIERSVNGKDQTNPDRVTITDWIAKQKGIE